MTDAPSSYPADPGGPLPAGGPKGIGFAVAALVLAVLAWVVPLLPIDLSGVRHYVVFPFGLAGFVLGVLGGLGNRRGKPLAVVAALSSALAVFLWVGAMMGNTAQA
ncbi:hypothetical protein ACFV4N_39170 [Actinosynnema sp. NPDC059797]